MASLRLKPQRLSALLGMAALLFVLLAVLLFWSGGAPNPAVSKLSRGSVIADSAILVFREGLETILVLAAVIASFRGQRQHYRRPVAGGATLALAATVATWFALVALISISNAPLLDVQAATGLLAVAVLLVVMNWFFHRFYWTGWIAHHNRRRRRLFDSAASQRRLLWGLALLGFTSVYREGFEVVLFLQTLRLDYGTGVVLEGTSLALVLTAVVGLLTFGFHQHLPYKRMLVVTGVLLGCVLMVMVGESVQEMEQAGWIGASPLAMHIPGWLGLWLAIFPDRLGLLCQLAAVALVGGCYLLANRRGGPSLPGPATRPPEGSAAPPQTPA